MQDLIFLSEDYTKRKPENYTLSISIRRDGFSYLITYKDEIKAYSYVTVSEENRISEFRNFLNQDILQTEFDAVFVIIVTPRFTLVPKKLYDDSMLDEYSALNFEHNEKESVISYESVNSNMVVLFPIETEVWAKCRSVFKDQFLVEYVPQVAPMIESVAKSKSEKLYVSVESDFATIIYKRDRDFQLCNSFEFKNVNDFLYYILNAVKQLNLNPLRLQIELSGKISQKSSYFTALQMFVKNVGIVANTTKQQDFPYSLFYNHLFVSLCE